MKTNSIVLLFILIFLITPGHPAVSDGSNIFALDSTCEDLSVLNLIAVVEQPQKKWVLIEVVPDQFSNMTVGFLDPTESTPTVVRWQRLVSGSYSVIRAFGAPLNTSEGKFSWPFDQIVTNFNEPFLRNSLFSRQSGNQVQFVCILNENQSGKAIFTDPVRVPISEQENLVPAIEFIRQHQEMLSNDLTPTTIAALESDISNPNHLVALAAVRCLVIAGQFSANDMATLLSYRDIVTSSAAVAIAQMYGWGNDLPNSQWLIAKISMAKSPAIPEAFAIGAHAASNILSSQAWYGPPQGSVQLTPGDYLIDKRLMAATRARLGIPQSTGRQQDLYYYAADDSCRSFGE
jgi:hypothetical protein